MRVAVGIKKGPLKRICEDAAVFNGNRIEEGLWEALVDRVCCVAVADGVGGNAGGELASTWVVKRLSEMIVPDLTAEKLRSFLEQMNTDLLSFASLHPGKEKMATTLTGLIGAQGGFWLVHSGNTRMYVQQGAYLRQYTTDHTTYRRLLAAGLFEAAENCNKNEINCCFGGGDNRYFRQVTAEWVFPHGVPETLLFTSDGVHEYVDLDTMEEILNESGTETEAVKLLLQKAEENGSADDKTVILLKNP